MSNITTTQNNALAISEGELMGVLRNSLYPGASQTEHGNDFTAAICLRSAAVGALLFLLCITAS